LDIVVEQPDLLARLEGGQADVGAAIASESITERAVSAGAHLALDGEVDLGQVVGGKLNTLRFLDGLELLVGFLALSGVFGSNAFSQAARAVLAGTPTLSRLRLALLG
jgi:hypothetical protein